MKIEESKLEDLENRNQRSPTLPLQILENEKLRGVICPNCGGALEGRKCKLFCTRRGCGYLVTCSEW